MPKIALVCDWLTTPGGAEKLLLELHQMYPEAPIYTSAYRPKKLDWFKDADVRTGWLNIFPACFRRILPILRQFYFSHLDLSNYDLVISVTGAEAKAVRTKSPTHQAQHICYCHVPTQYYWQKYDDYLKNPGFGFLNPIVRFFFRLFVRPLRRADYAAAQRVDQFVTISHYSQSQIQQYYHRDSLIIYPPVDTKQFSIHAPAQKSHSPKASPEIPAEISSENSPEIPAEISKDYFVISCRQVTWKRVDLAISACQIIGHPLVVIGDGPEHKNLIKKARENRAGASAGSQIAFLPWLPAPELAARLRGASAYIFPSEEPFGIAAVEALSAGCPVIAFGAGGSRDIITPRENGLFFSSQTPESLAQTLREFSQMKFSRPAVAKSAQKFDSHHFREGITKLVSQSSSQNSRQNSPNQPKTRGRHAAH